MKTLRIGRWLVEADDGATRACYGLMSHGAATDCGCPGCSNYLAAWCENIPAKFRALLESLGVDIDKECSVRRVAPLDAGHSLYAGSFAVAGRILEGPAEDNSGGWRLDVFEEVGETAHVALRDWPNPPAPWEEGATVRIRFLVTLPWTGEDPEAPIDLSGCDGPADKAAKRR